MTGKHYFLIGIGGIGMQAVARLLKARGATISGSDMNDFEARSALEKEGIAVHIGHDARHITDDVSEVIYSVAVPNSNPEIEAARKKNLPIRRRLELVGEIMANMTGVAIAGTHGKTTTTTMVTMMLQAGGKYPTSLIGAEVKSLKSNVVIGNGDIMVVEACEYCRSFLDLRPKVVVITNIEADHLDYYQDLDEIKGVFTELIDLIPDDGWVVANGDDPVVREVVESTGKKVIWAGFDESNEYRAENLEFIEGRLYFEVEGERLHMQIPGRHNVSNAVLAWAVSRSLGVDKGTVKDVLEDEFKGLSRRFEIFGTAKGITFVDDYAHHPTEIKAMLEGARQYFGKRRLVVVFHPHQYSRTRILLDDFAKSFQDADDVVVAPIYAVRDSEDEKHAINSQKLVDEINKVSNNARFLGDFLEIEERLKGDLKTGDVLITLGAGEADVFGRELLEKLRSGQT